jgi:hypothetical protein
MQDNKNKKQEKLDNGRYYIMHTNWWTPLQDLKLKFSWISLMITLISLILLIPFILWIVSR